MLKLLGGRTLNKKPLVSIICITYNHEKYIEQAIKGFLNQKTTFDYEIIIHDDASTDKTAKIVKYYSEKYPNKINAILQTENQYSKGKKFTYGLIRNIAKGKYIAFCEGDDYWIDAEKLQRQVDVLENNIEYVACCHNTIIVKKDNTPWDAKTNMFEYFAEDQIHSVKYLENDCRFCQTTSLLFKRDIISEMNQQTYNEFKGIKANGDMKFSAIIAANGKIYHIARDMACYRFVTDTGTSWSARNKEKNICYSTYTSLKSIQDFIFKNYSVQISYRYYLDYLIRSAVKRYISTKDSKDKEILIEILKNESIFHICVRTVAQAVKKLRSKREYNNLFKMCENRLEIYEKKMRQVTPNE